MSSEHTHCEHAPGAVSSEHTHCEHAPGAVSSEHTHCEHTPGAVSSEHTHCEHTPGAVSSEHTHCEHAPGAVSSEHTHCEHTPGAVGSSGARGAIGGSVLCSRAPQSWYWRWSEYCSFTIPTFNPCWTRDSNPQPLDYKYDSLTIRPQLPLPSISKRDCVQTTQKYCGKVTANLNIHLQNPVSTTTDHILRYSYSDLSYFFTFYTIAINSS